MSNNIMQMIYSAVFLVAVLYFVYSLYQYIRVGGFRSDFSAPTTDDDGLDVQDGAAWGQWHYDSLSEGVTRLSGWQYTPPRQSFPSRW